MTSGNGRGGLRPHGGGKSPPFIVIGLLVVIAILGFNYWSVSSKNTVLSKDIADLSERYRLASVKKLAVEKRNDALMAKVQESDNEVKKNQVMLTRKEEELTNVQAQHSAVADEASICKKELDSCSSEQYQSQQTIKTLQDQVSKTKSDLDECASKIKEFDTCKADLVAAREATPNCVQDLDTLRLRILEQVKLLWGSAAVSALGKSGIDITGVTLETPQSAGLGPDGANQEFDKALAAQPGTGDYNDFGYDENEEEEEEDYDRALDRDDEYDDDEEIKRPYQYDERAKYPAQPPMMQLQHQDERQRLMEEYRRQHGIPPQPPRNPYPQHETYRGQEQPIISRRTQFDAPQHSQQQIGRPNVWENPTGERDASTGDRNTKNTAAEFNPNEPKLLAYPKESRTNYELVAPHDSKQWVQNRDSLVPYPVDSMREWKVGEKENPGFHSQSDFDQPQELNRQRDTNAAIEVDTYGTRQQDNEDKYDEDEEYNDEEEYDEDEYDDEDEEEDEDYPKPAGFPANMFQHREQEEAQQAAVARPLAPGEHNWFEDQAAQFQRPEIDNYPPLDRPEPPPFEGPYQDPQEARRMDDRSGNQVEGNKAEETLRYEEETKARGQDTMGNLDTYHAQMNEQGGGAPQGSNIQIQAPVEGHHEAQIAGGLDREYPDDDDDERENDEREEEHLLGQDQREYPVRFPGQRFPIGTNQGVYNWGDNQPRA